MLYVVALVIFALDQLTKWIVRANLHNGQAVPIIPSVVEFLHIQNPGGAFSILPNQTWLFVLVALIVIVAVIFVHVRWHPSLLSQLGLGFLLGGAVGNMTDRIVQHTVTDFVYFYTIGFPIFNLADVAVDVGVILLLIQSFRGSQDTSSEQQDTNSKQKEDIHS